MSLPEYMNHELHLNVPGVAFEDVKEIDVLWLRPDVIESNMCIAFNHMTEEEQQAILMKLNPDDKVLLAHPCTNPACYAEEDPEITAWVKDYTDKKVRKRLEFRNKMDALQAKGMSWLEAYDIVSDEMYPRTGIDEW
jgi:hypothetical protein